MYARKVIKGLLGDCLSSLHVKLALAQGSYLVYRQNEEHAWIDEQERERLAAQAEMIERNLVPQLVSANVVIQGILDDLPAWQRNRDGSNLARQRLQLSRRSAVGIRSIVIMNVDGGVFSTDKLELVGRNLASQEGFRTARRVPNAKSLYVTPPFFTVLDNFTAHD